MLTTATGTSVCFLCMGHGKVDKLKIQLLERGEIRLPESGYYLPKDTPNAEPIRAALDSEST